MRNPLRPRRVIENNKDLRARAEKLAAQLPAIGTEHGTRWRARFGQNPARRAGSGDQFWQFRRFQPGDTASTVDWRKSAAADQLHVREREFESAEHYLIWCDRSPSMDYAGPASDDKKSTVAKIFTLALAIFLTRSHEHVALLPEQGKPLPATIDAMTTALSDTAAVTLPTSLPAIARINGGARPILISDFLDEPAHIAGWLKSDNTGNSTSGSIGGNSGVLVHLFDSAEAQLPFHGHVNFRGLEGESTIEIEHVGSIRAAYCARFQAHQQALQTMANRAGWLYLAHRTDEPLLPVLIRAIEGLADIRRGVL